MMGSHGGVSAANVHGIQAEASRVLCSRVDGVFMAWVKWSAAIELVHDHTKTDHIGVANSALHLEISSERVLWGLGWR